MLQLLELLLQYSEQPGNLAQTLMEVEESKGAPFLLKVDAERVHFWVWPPLLTHQKAELSSQVFKRLSVSVLHLMILGYLLETLVLLLEFALNLHQVFAEALYPQALFKSREVFSESVSFPPLDFSVEAIVYAFFLLGHLKSHYVIDQLLSIFVL